MHSPTLDITLDELSSAQPSWFIEVVPPAPSTLAGRAQSARRLHYLG